jgi:hypothetical protein
MKMALFSLVSLSRLFILSGLEQRKASARLLLKKKNHLFCWWQKPHFKKSLAKVQLLFRLQEGEKQPFFVDFFF